MQKIYLSSGFFTAATRGKVEEIAKMLREEGKEVFVPMEHFIENGEEMPMAEWAEKVFENDKKAIDDCDKMVVLDFGANGDCGTAWEVGYAYSKGKEILVIAYGIDISLMIAVSASAIIAAYEQDLKYV